MGANEKPHEPCSAEGVERGIRSFIEFIGHSSYKFVTSRFGSSQSKYKTITPAMLTKKSKKTSNTEDLGYSFNHKRFVKLSEVDFKRHTLITGASGYGKTTLLQVFFENNIKQGLPIVFIDPKGSLLDFATFNKLCKFYKRKLYVFSDTISGEDRRFFNPIRDMDNTKIASLIMKTFDWSGSPSFFLSKAEEALLRTLEKISQQDLVPNMHLIHDMVKKDYEKDDTVSGLITQLYNLKMNGLGRFLADNPRNPAVTMNDAIEEGACIYIGVNTQANGDFAKTIGKIFVNEILQISAIRNSTLLDPSQSKSFIVVIDELGSVIEPNFLELINKCRSANIQIFGAVQSLNDLNIKDSEGRVLLESLWESFSNYCIFKQSNPESIERLCRLVGTVNSIKKTKQTNDEMETGGGSIREVEEFLVHPNYIKSLEIGNTILVTQGKDRQVFLIKVRDPASSPAFSHPCADPQVELYSRRRASKSRTLSNCGANSEIEDEVFSFVRKLKKDELHDNY